MNARYPIVLLVASLLMGASTQLPAQDAPPPAPPAQPPVPPTTQPAADRAALEEKFIKQMSGCTLTGYFSDSNHPDKAPAAESYQITKVTKLNGDLYLFAAKFKMRGGEIVVPLVIPVKWAGDTPVISVTNMGIPGMGSYTARVLIYGDQYAGMWSGTNHGGNLWGKVEPAKEAEKPSGDEKPAEPKAMPAK